MRRILYLFKLFFALPAREKVWFVFAWFTSGIARASLLAFPFRKIAPRLGAHFNNTQLCVVSSDKQRKQAWRIGKVTEIATKYTPWESKCLVQAMVARILLSHYKIPYVLHLGVTKTEDPENLLKAHAWLGVGPWVITGREGHKQFAIVSTFVSPSLLVNPVNTGHSHA